MLTLAASIWTLVGGVQMAMEVKVPMGFQRRSYVALKDLDMKTIPWISEVLA